MQLINGIVNNVRKGNGNFLTINSFHIIFEINEKIITFYSTEPIVISENDLVSVVVQRKKNGYLGLAFNNQTKNVLGHNGALTRFVIGILGIILFFEVISIIAIQKIPLIVMILFCTFISIFILFFFLTLISGLRSLIAFIIIKRKKSDNNNSNEISKKIEFIKGISKNVSLYEISGENSSTYYSCFEIFGNFIIIRADYPVKINENNLIGVAGFYSYYGFMGLAYKDYSSGDISNSRYRNFIFMGLFCLIFTVLLSGTQLPHFIMDLHYNKFDLNNIPYFVFFLTISILILFLSINLFVNGFRLYQAEKLINEK